MTCLILIRHGESNSTVEHRIGGHRTCTGLSPLGRNQAERLRDRLLRSGEIAADVLISSHYLRARQTAEIIATGIGVAGIATWPGFGEHDPGEECDGMSYDEYTKRFSDFAWDVDPYTRGFPGGETVATFQHRVGVAVSQVLEQFPDKTVVVACHGGVIDAALRRALQAPMVGLFEVHTLNTAITEMRLVRPGRWKLVRYNDHSHIVDLPRQTAPS